MSGKITVISDDEFSCHAPKHFIFLEAFYSIKMIFFMSWKLLSYWLPFIVPEGSMQAIEEQMSITGLLSSLCYILHK